MSNVWIVLMPFLPSGGWRRIATYRTREKAAQHAKPLGAKILKIPATKADLSLVREDTPDIIRNNPQDCLSIARSNPSAVQAIWFHRDFWSPDQIHSWLVRHPYLIRGKESVTVDETKNYYAVRLQPPGRFKRIRAQKMSGGILFKFGFTGRQPAQT